MESATGIGAVMDRLMPFIDMGIDLT